MNAWSGVLGNISASDESLKKCLRFLRPNTGRRSGQFQSGIGIWQFGSSTHTRSLDYHHFFAFTQKKKKNRVAFRWIFNRRTPIFARDLEKHIKLLGKLDKLQDPPFFTTQNLVVGCCILEKRPTSRTMTPRPGLH